MDVTSWRIKAKRGNGRVTKTLYFEGRSVSSVRVSKIPIKFLMFLFSIPTLRSGDFFCIFKKKPHSMEKIKELEEKSKEYYAKWRETEELIADEKLKKVNLNFIGKFIKYKDPLDSVWTYLYVRDVFEDRFKYNSQKHSYCIRGVGFCGEFTGYSDATWFGLDFMQDIYVYGNTVEDFKKKIDSIVEISADDFINEFTSQVEKAGNKFTEFFKAVIYGKAEDLSAE